MSRRDYDWADEAWMEKTYLAEPTLETVKRIAIKLRRTRASVIQKLNHKGIYIKQVYLTKQGELPRKKSEILKDLEDLLEGREGGFSGMLPSSKESLVYLEGLVRTYFHELKDEILDLQKDVERLDAENLSLKNF